MSTTKQEIDVTKLTTVIELFSTFVEKVSMKQTDKQNNLNQLTQFKSFLYTNLNQPDQIATYINNITSLPGVRKTSQDLRPAYDSKNNSSTTNSNHFEENIYKFNAYFGKTKILGEIYNEPNEDILSLHDSKVIHFSVSLSEVMQSPTKGNQKTLFREVFRYPDFLSNKGLYSHPDISRIMSKLGVYKEIVTIPETREGFYLAVVAKWFEHLMKDSKQESINVLINLFNFVYQRKISLVIPEYSTEKARDYYCEFMQAIIKLLKKRATGPHIQFYTYLSNSLVLQNCLVAMFKELVISYFKDSYDQYDRLEKLKSSYSAIEDEELDAIAVIVQSDIKTGIVKSTGFYEEKHTYCKEVILRQTRDTYTNTIELLRISANSGNNYAFFNNDELLLYIITQPYESAGSISQADAVRTYEPVKEVKATRTREVTREHKVNHSKPVNRNNPVSPQNNMITTPRGTRVITTTMLSNNNSQDGSGSNRSSSNNTTEQLYMEVTRKRTSAEEYIPPKGKQPTPLRAPDRSGKKSGNRGTARPTADDNLPIKLNSSMERDVKLYRDKSEAVEVTLVNKQNNYVSPNKPNGKNQTKKHGKKKSLSIDITGQVLPKLSDDKTYQLEELPGTLKVKIEDINNLVAGHTAEISDIMKRYPEKLNILTVPTDSKLASLMSMYQRLNQTNAVSTNASNRMQVAGMMMDSMPSKQPQSEDIQQYEELQLKYNFPPMNLKNEVEMYITTSQSTPKGKVQFADIHNYDEVVTTTTTYVQPLINAGSENPIMTINDNSAKYVDSSNLNQILSSFTLCIKCGREFLRLNDNDSDSHTCYLCR
jgi:hypothetical protein